MGRDDEALEWLCQRGELKWHHESTACVIHLSSPTSRSGIFHSTPLFPRHIIPEREILFAYSIALINNFPNGNLLICSK
jgi:hypothetical protein